MGVDEKARRRHDLQCVCIEGVVDDKLKAVGGGLPIRGGIVEMVTPQARRRCQVERDRIIQGKKQGGQGQIRQQRTGLFNCAVKDERSNLRVVQ